MTRYNVFLSIHKGLRLMMYDVSKDLQHTDFDSADNNPTSLQKLSETLDIFDAHAGHEDNFIFSMLTPHAPELVAEMEAEHETDHQLSHELRTLIAAYKDATDAHEKHTLGTRICHSYNAFIAFNLTHLTKEETVVNEVLWKHYTDMDIIMANRALVGSLKPEEIQMSAIWMIRSNSNNELIKWLKGMKNNVPPPVMDMLMGMAKTELAEERFGTIIREVTEVAV